MNINFFVKSLLIKTIVYPSKNFKMIFFSFMFFIVSFIQFDLCKELHNGYFEKLQKPKNQIVYAKMTNIAVGLLQYTTIALSFATNNHLMMISNFTSLGAGCLTGIVLKKIVKEQRPDDKDNFKSFPSGHTICAFCSAFIIFLYLKKRKYIFGSLAILCALMVSIGRVASLRHYPVDVICGFFISLFYCLLSFYIVKAINIYLNRTNPK